MLLWGLVMFIVTFSGTVRAQFVELLQNTTAAIPDATDEICDFLTVIENYLVEFQKGLTGFGVEMESVFDDFDKILSRCPQDDDDSDSDEKSGEQKDKHDDSYEEVITFKDVLPLFATLIRILKPLSEADLEVKLDTEEFRVGVCKVYNDTMGINDPESQPEEQVCSLSPPKDSQGQTCTLGSCKTPVSFRIMRKLGYFCKEDTLTQEASLKLVKDFKTALVKEILPHLEQNVMPEILSWVKDHRKL